MFPAIRGDHVGRVRRVLQHIVAAVHFPGFDGVDLGVNGDQGVTEAVQLGLGFAFGGLDHHCARNGPGNRWRMETVIHQSLGHILDRHALERAQIQDALMRHQPARPPVEHREVGMQPPGHVVGVEDGKPRRFR